MSKKQLLVSLLPLSNAPSKQFIEQIFYRVYQTRLDGLNENLISSVSQQLKIEEEESKDLLNSILYHIKQALLLDLETIEEVKVNNSTKDLLIIPKKL
jgi:ferritin-like protein